MRREADRYKAFTRRTALLAGGKALLLSAVVGRMYYLQVIESDRYTLLADENRINLRLLPPPRGRIVDRFNVALAVNRQNYRVVLIAERTRDAAETLAALSEIILLTDSERDRILREVGRKRGFIPITVRENLSWSDVSRIEVNTPALPGLHIGVGRSRHYPHGGALAHVLGYVAAVSERERTGEPLLELSDFRVGKDGIEKQHDLALRGKAGTSQVEVNAVGRVIRELSRQAAKLGQEIMLTLDLGLQEFVMGRLGAESAAAVVLDVHSGDVLAMTSTPSFDPNAFNEGMSAESWTTLVSNPRAPLTNKCIAGQYAPGSTFKMMVALAALEGGIVGPDHQFSCSGELTLGDSRFHCWRKGGHGLMAMEEAIKQSCDVYFYELSRRVGIDRIAAMARRFGMGQALSIDLPGEQPGLVPTPQWKRDTYGTSWQQGETLITGIGQGFILATPLQLAVMMARIANGGQAIVPRVTRRLDGIEAEQGAAESSFEPLGIDPAALALVNRATSGVVNDPLGTAFKARIERSEFAMGGKTGTVQVRRITVRERELGIRRNEELPWAQRDHAVFIGYAPVRAPRYAAAVVVEHGGDGASVAAPLARDILLEAQQLASPRKRLATERVGMRGA